MTSSLDGDSLQADVLVIGGGPAGAWAAWQAARDGATVVLADKGYVGTSGATAPSGTGVWYVLPEAVARENALTSREALGGHLADRAWGHRVLDQTYENLQRVADWGYPFPVDDQGVQRRTSLQGPDYMKLMRRVVRQVGVKVLDHSPALELLTDRDGAVVGARGIGRLGEVRDWTVRAKAVVIATGGCAFLSKALGCNVLTGDGYLLGAEAGAEFSGMEFSNAYGLGPAHSSVTKSAFYRWATFRYADGSLIEGAGSKHGRSVIARHLQAGTPVYALLDLANEDERRHARGAQPNFFLPFDRIGVDPFTQQFPVTLRLEGTVRGTGGLRIVDNRCATTVPGLFAAGDAATRELICGAFTGGGSHNAAWATSSGTWAGAGAAAHAKADGADAHGRTARSEARAALNGAQTLDTHGLIEAVQREVLPYDRNLFRDPATLRDSLERLDGYWAHLQHASAGTPTERLRARGRRDGGHGALDVPQRPRARREPWHAQAHRPPGHRPVAASPRAERRARHRLDAPPPHARPRTTLRRGGRMIELVSEDRCTGCDLCVQVCPTHVFDAVPGGIPVIARQTDCQTCFMCEAWCPVDALYVAPFADEVKMVDEAALVDSALLGSYRRTIGWAPGTRGTAIDHSYRLLRG